jgi:hypothetical protein
VSRVTPTDRPETVIDGWYVDAAGVPKHKPNWKAHSPS